MTNPKTKCSKPVVELSSKYLVSLLFMTLVNSVPIQVRIVIPL